MSHYTTTTASYILSKYSRSYPSTSSLQSQPSAESDWQHFTNPVLRLFLDVKKSPSGDLVSMRLRILWNIDVDSSDMNIDQREVIFEDLELLSFSSLPTFRAQTTPPDQGLPLKAVYRDAVVGIRYLHPRTVPPGCQPLYRRFQITFGNISAASQFVDAIRSVCPCKANPQPSQINRHPTMLSGTLARATTSTTGFMTQPGLPESPHGPALLQRPSMAASPLNNSTLTPSAVSGLRPNNSLLPNRPSSATLTNLSSDDSGFVTCSETSHKPDRPANKRKAISSSNFSNAARSSLPNSSQPSSSNDSSAMPPPPVPRNHSRPIDALTHGASRAETMDVDRPNLLSSLRESPSLYDLSRADLETLVSQVVREEGFARLLDSLDSMWRIKGFLAR
ncbi:hypothetical protein HYDPIDRAFT_173798 [Hydnomerulius pinastri MD-312]|nr:hypothetical protein HYDPIDRAFT_173798 [Hydnomerulius pinastri MD-312]